MAGRGGPKWYIFEAIFTVPRLTRTSAKVVSLSHEVVQECLIPVEWRYNSVP